MIYDEFIKKLDEVGITRQDFAEMTEMSQTSIYNWSSAKRPIPGWVDSWIENYKKSKTLDIVIEAIDSVRK